MVLATLGVLLFCSCSSDSVREEIDVIDPNSTDPLNFTCLLQENEQQAVTRASSLLTSDFMVSAYKNYGDTKQQTVMNCYHVEYKTTGTAWDGTSRAYWDYTGVTGQFVKYWDYSAFPYRFNAVAPYPTALTGFELSDKSIKIPATFKMQTCTDGVVTPADAEPHLIAQLQRNTDGTDHDILGSGSVNNSSTTKNRYVAMPFHHLNSKIRFGVYTTTQWLTANKTYIKDLSVRIVSSSFVKEASNYQATGTGSWIISDGSGFQSTTTDNYSSTSPLPVFNFAGGKEVPGNDLTQCQTRQTAFFLQCPQGIMQIPQKEVQMIVSFKLYTYDDDSSPYMEFTDVPIKLVYPEDTSQNTDKFDWTTGYIHTYYLVIGEVENKLEITFTATLTPWEDVSGSLTTDLEQ